MYKIRFESNTSIANFYQGNFSHYHHLFTVIALPSATNTLGFRPNSCLKSERSSRPQWETLVIEFPLPMPPLRLLMNTTSTAQYAAEAAKSSCLCAFVRRDIAAEKSNVKVTRTPTALKVDCELLEIPPISVSLYIAITGKIRSVKMMAVMMMPISFSTRFFE